MYHQNAENIVKHILEQDGYRNYRITTNSHTTGTNVRIVVAVEGDVTITFTMDDETGIIFDKKISKMNKVRNEEQNIPVSDMVLTKTSLFFELHDKIFIGGNMLNSQNFELIRDVDDNRYLKAFRITVSDTSDRTINNAIEEANRFTNYLTTLTNIVVNHKRPRISVMKNGVATNSISYTMDAVLVKVQDIDVTKLELFLKIDSRLQQHLKHYHDGLDALLDNNFAEAIRNFYQIIENQGTSDSKKYGPLRNGISHEELDKDPTIKGLASFGINIQKNDHVNLNDPNIQDILQRESENLKRIVWTYLDNELKKLE